MPSLHYHRVLRNIILCYTNTHTKKKQLRPSLFLTEVSKNYYNFQNFLSDKIICHKPNRAKRSQHREREWARLNHLKEEMLLGRKEKSTPAPMQDKLYQCPDTGQTSPRASHSSGYQVISQETQSHRFAHSVCRSKMQKFTSKIYCWAERPCFLFFFICSISSCEIASYSGFICLLLGCQILYYVFLINYFSNNF